VDDETSMSIDSPPEASDPHSFESPNNPERRRILTAATVTMGAIGVGLAAVPFIESWEPSERARAQGSPVEIDTAKLEPGQMLTVLWRRKPVWVLRRTSAQLAELPKLNDELKDPLSRQAQQPPDLPHWNSIWRSINPEILVLVGICTHLGCLPKYRPNPDDPTLGANWQGGFFCPCHGSRYDLAGRVMNGSPAPLNLPVPPHFYRTGTVIVAGEIRDGTEQTWQPVNW
jgi:ubiquinol-cytochrome c reductase iron-sulfur subunit